MFNSLRPHGLRHPWPPYPSPSPEVCPSDKKKKRNKDACEHAMNYANSWKFSFGFKLLGGMDCKNYCAFTIF